MGPLTTVILELEKGLPPLRIRKGTTPFAPCLALTLFCPIQNIALAPTTLSIQRIAATRT